MRFLITTAACVLLVVSPWFLPLAIILAWVGARISDRAGQAPTLLEQPGSGPNPGQLATPTILLGPDHRVRRANAAFAHLIDGQDEPVGTGISTLLGMDPGEAAAAFGRDAGEWSLTHRTRRLRIARAPLGEGCTLVQFIDVTHESRGLQVLSQTQRTLSRFAGDAAHDLKSPLTAVSGMAQLLSGDEDLMATSHAPVITMMVSSSQQAIRTVDRILRDSRDLIPSLSTEHDDPAAVVAQRSESRVSA